MRLLCPTPSLGKLNCPRQQRQSGLSQPTRQTIHLQEGVRRLNLDLATRTIDTRLSERLHTLKQ